MNFTGIVLPFLNVRTGFPKLPPVASAPPMGGRKPANPRATRVTVKEPVELLPLASVAVQVTVVAPTGKPLPEAGEQETTGDGSQLSVAVTENVTGTSKSVLHET